MKIDIVSQLIWMIYLLPDEDKKLIRDSIYLSTEETPQVWKTVFRKNYKDFITDYRLLSDLYGTEWVTDGKSNRKIIKHLEEPPEGFKSGFTRKKELNSAD